MSILCIAGTLLLRPASACGPFFPNSMLDLGDDAVLAAPKADFAAEVELLQLPRTKFKAHNETNFANEAAAADEADLGRALKEKNLPAQKRRAILQNYEQERARLTDFRSRVNDWNPNGDDEWVNGQLVHHEPKPKPVLDAANPSNFKDVPAEFVDYLQGSTAWFDGDTNKARANWETLLRLAAGDRHYRSTWAAYMLGKSWAAEDPEKAIGYFQEARALRLAGFADRIGLAASSIGGEAQVLFRQKKYEAALNLYISQLATGDTTAINSLLEVCRAIVSDEGVELNALAANSTTRRVISAFILQGSHDDFCERWLAAVETVDVRDVESAEQLALAAYQTGKWTTAQRWIKRASQTPTAKWLQAKLLLRGGKTREAAVILQHLAELFPAQPHPTNDAGNAGLHNALYMTGTTYAKNEMSPGDDISIRRQIQAETGVLHLARREYTQSLDALLRAGFWMDAAYVAERVLTEAELKNYVDQDWAVERETQGTNDDDSTGMRERIRGLLARRLARAGYFDEARPYYPAEQLTNYDLMVTNLDAANNPASSARQRVAAYTAAAFIFRTNGMELLGTEVWPDWRIVDGDYADFFDPTSTRQATNTVLVPASPDELARERGGIDPALRFHYRYQAASLAWEAASLMADNTDEKARILCTAGGWLKYRDPRAADYFYKALVRYCRKTAIGAQADRMRWFPSLDDNGNPLPWHTAKSTP